MGISYTISGEKIDSNAIRLGSQNIIWRTNLEASEIARILDRINARIVAVSDSLGVDSFDRNVEFTESRFNNVVCHTEHSEVSNCFDFPANHEFFIESRFYKSYKKPNFYQKMFSDKILKRLKNRDFSFLTKEFLSKKIRKNRARFYNFSFLESLESFKDKKSLKSYINTNIFLCKNKDWVKEYQNSVKPVIIGRFYIRPSWSLELKNMESPNFSAHKLIELIINPSLSFGSGHHPSTAMCIDFLSNHKDTAKKVIESRTLKDKKMLDVGCGSGILSLVGAKLGANIYACDTDSFAISQTKNNFKINNLKYKKLWCGSVTAENNNLQNIVKYDIIVANIITSIILILKNELINSLEDNGILILSGILKEKKNDIISNFSSLKLLEMKEIDGWLGFKFMKP